MGINKRGMTDIQLFVIGEAILAMLVFVALEGYVSGVASNSLFEKNFMARDVALLIDSAYASPGSTNIIYDTDTRDASFFMFGFTQRTNFTFAFDQSKVLVFEKSDVLYEKPVEYYFSIDKNLDFQIPYSDSVNSLDVVGQEYSIPKKEGDIRIIKDNKQLNLSVLSEAVQNDIK